jgi:hypothetical protein
MIINKERGLEEEVQQTDFSARYALFPYTDSIHQYLY